MCNPDPNTIFTKQFDLAWEHFKFHAEQRTRMFYFFLLAIGLLLNAFSLLIRSGDANYQAHAFVLLCLGGLLATIFLSLDVRNTQLLEYSEGLLRKIERDTLYNHWREEIVGGDIRLGILSREALLKDFLKTNKKTCSQLRWICIDNIKHKFAIRSIETIAMVSFWIGAYVTAPSTMKVPLLVLEVEVQNLIAIAAVLCVIWGFYALLSPGRDLKWEQEALRVEDKREKNTAEQAAGIGNP